MIYADASFLVALFSHGDDHWHRAWRWWRGSGGPLILVSRLTIFEAENSIRALGVSRQFRPAAVHAALEGIRRALLEGVIARRSVPEQRLFPHAARLSQHHTVTRTYGALDIMHVAIALEIGAKSILSFDQRQREIAEAEGLWVVPA